MPSILPQEIVETIIEEIDDGSSSIKNHTFRSCSLVSQSFRDPAQKRLLRYLLIDPATASQYEKLCKTLQSSPRICSFVESMCFIIDTDNISARSTSDSEELPDLPRLRHVTVTAGTYGGCPGEWPVLPAAFKDDLCEIIRRPTVAVLSIYLISGFPVGIVCSCPQLTMLDIWDVSFTTGSYCPSPSDSSTPSTEAEQMHILKAFSETGTTVVRPPLHASLNESAPPSSTLRIKHSGFSYFLEDGELVDWLENRDAVIPYFEATESNTQSVANSLNLPNLRALRRLSNDLQGRTTIHAVWALLQRFPNIDNLVELTITTNVGSLMRPSIYPVAPVWADIDRHLTEHRPPGAKRTTVIITLSNTGPYSTEAIRTFFREMVPRLLERGQLKVELYWPDRVPAFVTIMPLV
ncbi:hypothetical protein FPV67DRAFT_1676440 [Lyophyllum atratum]|nr:hypothetical protein FPV67DRAFT_1676440 [Lyophyllum atratum]